MTSETTGHGRIRLVAGGLAAAATTIALLVATRPWGERLDSSADEVLSYETLLAHRDSAWLGMAADGLALGVLAVCLALTVCHLVRDRGRLVATVGSVLTVLGGVLFAMGALGFAQVGWFATGLPEDDGRTLVSYANDQVAHLLGVEMAGFLLFTVGTLTLAVALARARAVPLAAVVAFGVLTVALFLPIPGRAIDVVQIAQVLLVGALGAQPFLGGSGKKLEVRAAYSG